MDPDAASAGAEENDTQALWRTGEGTRHRLCD